MPGIMAEETYLSKDKCQEDSIQKLEPENVYEEQKSNAHSEQSHGIKNLEGIVYRLLIQQTALLNQFF